MVRSCLVACASVLVFSSVAHAAAITFQFTGIVDPVVAFYDPAFIDDPTNAVFAGTFTFDSTAADAVSGSSSGGYVGSSLTLALTSRNFSFPSVDIGVNDFAGLDQYLVGFTDAFTFLSIRFEDAEAGALGGDALPQAAPSLVPFETRFMTFQLYDAGFAPLLDLNATITSLTCVDGCEAEPIPEPATLSLLAAGVGLLAARRRAAGR